MIRRSWLILALLTPATSVWAGPWTRDPGSFYAQVSIAYMPARARFISPPRGAGTSGLAGRLIEFCPPPRTGALDCRFLQTWLGFYGELGVVKRWLTLIMDGTVHRDNRLEQRGATSGPGDWTLGLWTGLITSPIRLTFALTAGFPVGDKAPRTEPGADAEAQGIARSLPTGDGKWDVEGRLSLGHQFGGKGRWPLMHYLVVEAAYWRRAGTTDDRRLDPSVVVDGFLYRFELGISLPRKGLDRLSLALRLNGVESFAHDGDATEGDSGLAYAVVGAQLSIRLWKGLGVFGSYERIVHGRSTAAGDIFRAGLSYMR